MSQEKLPHKPKPEDTIKETKRIFDRDSEDVIEIGQRLQEGEPLEDVLNDMDGTDEKK